MTSMPRRTLLALAFCTLPLAVAAQAYPDKLVRVIIPYPAGSAVDVVGRTLFTRLSTYLGQPIIVDNKVGANGNIGMAQAAQAPKDGYTLLFTPTQLVSNPGLGKTGYDPVKDFTPVMLTSRIPALLVVPAASPAKNVAELSALARAKPGTLSYASGGNGGIGHFSGEAYKTVAGGLDIVHIPYKAASEQVNSVIAGDTQLAFPAMSLALPFVESGRLRALAVTGAKRHPLLPQVPTMAEAQPPGFVLEAWYGLLAPAGVPPEVVARLNAEMAKVLREPEVRKTLLAGSHDIAASTPAEFTDVIAKDLRVWGDLARKLNVKVD